MELRCRKCEDLIYRHKGAVHDLAQVTAAFTDQAEDHSTIAQLDEAWNAVLLAGERCLNLRSVISTHIGEHSAAGNAQNGDALYQTGQGSPPSRARS